MRRFGSVARGVVFLTVCFGVACGTPPAESFEPEASRVELPPDAGDHPVTCSDPDIGRVGGADKAPVLVRKVEPDFEGVAPKGMSVVEVIVDRNGDVCAARVLRGLTPEFDRAALEAVEQWKFLPAQLRGEPVQVAYTVTIVAPAK